MVGGEGAVMVVQVAPGSTVQVGEQPSPALMLPSSHASLGNLMPSPQMATHGAAVAPAGEGHER